MGASQYGHLLAVEGRSEMTNEAQLRLCLLSSRSWDDHLCCPVIVFIHDTQLMFRLISEITSMFTYMEEVIDALNNQVRGGQYL